MRPSAALELQVAAVPLDSPSPKAGVHWCVNFLLDANMFSHHTNYLLIVPCYVFLLLQTCFVLLLNWMTGILFVQPCWDLELQVAAGPLQNPSPKAWVHWGIDFALVFLSFLFHPSPGNLSAWIDLRRCARAFERPSRGDSRQ